jgi:hypothetical protein
VNTDNINKWKKNLSLKDLDIISYVLNEYGKEFHYIPELVRKKYPFHLIIAMAVNCMDLVIIKGYHLLPVRIRYFIKTITNYLFSRFGYKSFYNFSDHRVILKNDN